ncbi:hypothetical protein F5Y15DRAFT_424684 [Xylariaceae sp. FL0016]|nr:hypothetical protein F5Y15DRAFT_424684 [Xylariaceae sp. FL0016]
MNPSHPAAYGRTCAGCVKAKSKCYYRAEGTECERCHRLGKSCEQSAAVRKRRTRAPRSSSMSKSHSTCPSAAAPEAKSNSIVSHLQVQQRPTPSSWQTTPTTVASTRAVEDGVGKDEEKTRNPDVIVDADSTVVHLLRPSPSSGALPVAWNDVASHFFNSTATTNEEQLDIFRRVFIPMFPFVHISETVTTAKFCRQRPFLWLVVMALTSKSTAQQFKLERAIWEIVSRRIVAEQLVDIDLLLGLVCFASWSHYFKKDKPFMTMLSQLAVALSFELGIHCDSSSKWPRRDAKDSSRGPSPPQPRTMEERRTMLSVFHVTSATWATYRKTEPLRWTPYLDQCLQVLCEQEETPYDHLLVAQVKCQLVTNQLTCFAANEENQSVPSGALTAGLLHQLGSIRHSMPEDICSHSNLQATAQSYLTSTNLTIHDAALRPTNTHLHLIPPSQANSPSRLQTLTTLLDTASSYLTSLTALPPTQWLGISVDVFAQLTHALVVLFKLTTLHLASPASTPAGWCPALVPDVFAILDDIIACVDRVPRAAGLVVDNDDDDDNDAPGARRSLFCKADDLFRAIKVLFRQGMGEHAPTAPGTRAVVSGLGVGDDHGHGTEEDGHGHRHENSHGNKSGEVVAADADEGIFSESFLLDLAHEPWLADIMGSSWNFAADFVPDEGFGDLLPVM